MHPKFLACITRGRRVAPNEVENTRGGKSICVLFLEIFFVVVVFSLSLPSVSFL